MGTNKAAGQKDRSCGTCAAFDPRKPGGGVNEDSGICRLRGPTVGHVSTMVLGDDEETWVPTVQILTHWCAVDPAFDWCPDYSPLPRETPVRPPPPSTGEDLPLGVDPPDPLTGEVDPHK